MARRFAYLRVNKNRFGKTDEVHLLWPYQYNLMGDAVEAFHKSRKSLLMLKSLKSTSEQLVTLSIGMQFYHQ